MNHLFFLAERISKSLTAKIDNRKHRQTVLPQSAEVLENRCLLSVNPLSEAGQFGFIGGVSEVNGNELHVNVMVWVPDGADANEIGLAALDAQNARPYQSAAYSTINQEWGQFSDSDTGNDFVEINYNPANDPFSGATNDGLSILQIAQQAWTDVAGSSFEFASGDTNISNFPSLVKESPGRQFTDGENDFAWMEIKDRNTLGVTWSVPGEADVAINTKFNWFNDGATNYDAQTVIIHELGHVTGLGHSTTQGAIMEAIYAGVNRELHQDDEDGISFLYPAPQVGEAPVVSISSPVQGSNPFTTGSSIVFSGSATDAEDGDVTASLVWTSDIDGQIGTDGDFSTTLSDGVHTITATATDSNGNSSSDSITLTVGNPPAVATTVSVDSITYDTNGGRNKDRNLSITIALLDDFQNPTSGAAVSIKLQHDSGSAWTGTSTTGTDGKVTFTLSNARKGTYTTTVTDVSADGLTWDGVTPGDNTFAKFSSRMEAPAAEIPSEETASESHLFFMTGVPKARNSETSSEDDTSNDVLQPVSATTILPSGDSESDETDHAEDDSDEVIAATDQDVLDDFFTGLPSDELLSEAL